MGMIFSTAWGLGLWNDTSKSGSGSELALSSGWLGTSASSEGNEVGFLVADFFDLGMLGHWLPHLQVIKYSIYYLETNWLQSASQ